MIVENCAYIKGFYGNHKDYLPNAGYLVIHVGLTYTRGIRNEIVGGGGGGGACVFEILNVHQVMVPRRAFCSFLGHLYKQLLVIKACNL